MRQQRGDVGDLAELEGELGEQRAVVVEDRPQFGGSFPGMLECHRIGAFRAGRLI